MFLEFFFRIILVSAKNNEAFEIDCEEGGSFDALMQYLPPSAADSSRAMPQPLLHHTLFILLEYSEIYVSLKRRKILLILGRAIMSVSCFAGKMLEGKHCEKL